jgi:GxxExxY protein
MENFLFKDETYQIIGICMEVHNILGHGFLEIVYKDAIEYELQQRKNLYEREKEYIVHYKDIVLKHNFYADFVVFNNIILEVKAAEGGISDEFISRTLNYLKVSGCKVGLIVNFARVKLEYKRLVY